MYSRNLFVLDFARRFFVSCAQIFEAYAVRTLIKFGCDWRKIGRKGRCMKDSERTVLFRSSYSCKRHATKCPGVISFSFSPSSLQRSVAYGQRSAKRQPGFGLIGEVTSPLMISSFFLYFKDAIGIAFKSAFVYGCSGWANSSSVGASSTHCPKYITAMLSLICLITLKL